MKSFATSLIPIANIISYWKFENNVLDSDGINDGVASNITYAAGKVGNSAVLNGSNSFIQIPGINNLSFGNGVTDSPFSISFWVKLNSLGDAWLINKRDGTGSPVEYQISLFSGNLRVQLFGQNSTATQLSYSVGNTLSIGVWSQIFITYDGSSSQNGLNFYVNSIEQGGTKTQTGTYISMSNTSSSVIFGRAGWFLGFYLNGSMDETAYWNKELTQTEIDNVYAKGNAGLPLI